MQENEKKVAEREEAPNWDDFLDLLGDAARLRAGEKTIASETISELKRESKRRNWDMAVIGAISVIAIIGLLLVNHNHSQANERNNQRWIEYLSQYDFVSQDGEGYNYYNSDVGGDVVNGTENPKKAE